MRSCFWAICLLAICDELAGAEDRRLIVKSGQNITVSDLTLIPYEHALQLVDEVVQQSGAKEFAGSGATFVPGLESWKPDDDHGALPDFYQHILQGAVGHLVISDVYDVVKKEFPLGGGSGYDPSKLEAYSIAYIDNEIARRQFISRAYADAKSPADFASILFKRSPYYVKLNLDPTDPAMQAWCGFEDRTYVRAVDACFPVKKGGVVAPWVRGTIVAGLIHFHLVADIQRRPSYYDAVYTKYHGLPTVALLRCPEEIPQSVVDQIGKSLITSDGRVAQRGIRELRETMSRLGGELSIEVDQILIESLHQLVGTKSGDGVVGRIHHDKQARVHQYLYVGAQTLNAEQVRMIREPSFRQPGSPFYDAAREETLLPVVRRVLATMQPEEGFEIPDEVDLTGHCGNSGVDEFDFWRNPLPKIVRP